MRITAASPRCASSVTALARRCGGTEEMPRYFAEDETVDPSKRTVVVDEYDGRFLKRCPGTRGHVCCGYLFINVATGCPMDCTYCILQEYLTDHRLRVFCNIDDMLDELDETFEGTKEFFRAGTGELTDSLAVDWLTGYSRVLVPFFANRDNAVLELKSKTDFIGNLVGLDHGGRTIVAWSLNPPEVVSSEERFTSETEARIKAASRIVEDGYPVAFHFDPIVHYPGWKEGYSTVVEMLADQRIPEEKIAWISMGTVRFMPRLYGIIEERHPHSKVRMGEFVTGRDGKQRYFRPIRVEMYRHLLSNLRRVYRDVCIYLCMESMEVWRDVFGVKMNSSILKKVLDDAAREKCKSP